jgi:hypothetical protein
MYGVTLLLRAGRAVQLDLRRPRVGFVRKHRMYREIRPVDSRAQLSRFQSVYSRYLKLHIAVLLQCC